MHDSLYFTIDTVYFPTGLETEVTHVTFTIQIPYILRNTQENTKPYKLMFVVMPKKTIEQTRCFEILEEPALSDCQTTIVVTSIDIRVLTLLPCQNFGNFSAKNTSCYHVITALWRASWPSALSHNL